MYWELGNNGIVFERNCFWLFDWDLYWNRYYHLDLARQSQGSYWSFIRHIGGECISFQLCAPPKYNRRMSVSTIKFDCSPPRRICADFTAMTDQWRAVWRWRTFFDLTFLPREPGWSWTDTKWTHHGHQMDTQWTPNEHKWKLNEHQMNTNGWQMNTNTRTNETSVNNNSITHNIIRSGLSSGRVGSEGAKFRSWPRKHWTAQTAHNLMKDWIEQRKKYVIKQQTECSRAWDVIFLRSGASRPNI